MSHSERRQWSACRVHLAVLVELIVEVVKSLVAVVPVQVDVVGLWYINGFKGAGNKGHKLTEYADAAMPEGGLWQAACSTPRASGGVVDLHHVRQLKGVVIATGHIETTTQSCHTASDMDLRERVLLL